MMFDFIISHHFAMTEALLQVQKANYEARIQRLEAEVNRERLHAEYYHQLYLHEKMKNEMA